MNPIPTGRVTKNTAETYDLILTRTFEADVDDVWASVTESERTARWFGAWRGEAGPGRTVELQMGFEEDTPWADVRIDACRAPHHLAITMNDEHGDWKMELNLAEADGVTTLELRQHLIDPANVENTGPGWEYYLDMLVAARKGAPLPDFGDYYPAQSEHFAAQWKALD